MTQDIHERLEAIFREVLREDIELTDELTAGAVDGWDSLSHVSIIYAVEEDFRIRLTQDEMVDMANVGDLKACIARKLERAG